MDGVQVRCHVPFCVHCAGATGMAAAKFVNPNQFPLFCDACGFVTLMLTPAAFLAKMRSLGNDFPDLPDDTDGILFCEAPTALA